MRRVVDAGAVLLDADFPLEVVRHAIEFGDHGLDLRDLAPFLVDLKFLQADERLTGLHRLLLPEVADRGHAHRALCLHRMWARAHGGRSGTPTPLWRDNVSVRFPRRPRFRPTDGILPPSWLLLPYLGQEKLRAACAAG